QDWVRWWGGEATYQQSPLYAYLISTFQRFTNDLIYIEIFQAAISVLLCVLLGFLGFELTQSKAGGWIAFVIAGAYAPFYAYSFALLRDSLSWAITAGLLLSLTRLQQVSWQELKASKVASLTGVLLGLGFL